LSSSATINGFLPNADETETPIGFLYLSPSPRLEPLWPLEPYSARQIGSDHRRQRDGRSRLNCGVISQSVDEAAHKKTKVRSQAMDVVVLGIGILSFALLFAYIKACENL
jgi:hypothetical protein